MRVHEISSRFCSFAILDAPVGSKSVVRSELLYSFEAYLPCSIEDVVVVFSTPLNGKIVACACSRDVLQEYRLNYEAVILESFPEWIQYDDKVRASLNLLSGDIRPISTENRARTTSKIVCFASLVIALLMLIAVHRHADSNGLKRLEIEGEINRLYNDVLTADTSSSSMPNAIRFAAMVNEAQATRTGDVESTQPDLVADMATIFDQFPADTHIQLELFTLSSSSLRLSVAFYNNDDALVFIEQLSQLKKWEIKNRTLKPSENMIELDATLERGPSLERRS